MIAGNEIKQTRWKIFLWASLAIITALKAATMFSGLKSLDGDEAIIGIMARHILARLGHPVYMYGQSYGAGAGLEAHLAAVVTAIAGADVVALKITAFVVFLVFLLTTWMAAKKMFGKDVAALSLVLAAAAPTSAIWFSKLRGGHISAMALMMIAFYLVSKIADGKRNGRKSSYLTYSSFGITAASAAWLQPTVAPAIFVLFIIALGLTGKMFFKIGAFWAMIASAAAVSIPFYLAIPDDPIWTVASEGGRSASAGFISLTSLFTPFLDGIIPPAPLWIKAIGWAWLFAGLSAVGMIFYAQVKNINDKKYEYGLVILPILFIVLAGFIFSGAEPAPRRFIAVYPLFCISMAIVLNIYSNNSRREIINKIIVVILIISSIAVQTRFFGEPTIYGAGTQRIPMPAVNVNTLINALEARNVKYVSCADYMLKWNIIFESGEKIITSNLRNAPDRYPPYDAAVAEAKRAGATVPTIYRIPEDVPIWQRFSDVAITSPEKVSRVGNDIFIVWEMVLETLF